MFNIYTVYGNKISFIDAVDDIDEAFEIAYRIICKTFKLGTLDAVSIYQNKWLCYEFVSYKGGKKNESNES